LNLLPCIVGPTGVGKSEIAYQLAKSLGAEILSVDAFQFYRHLPIGTNHPDPAWLKDIPHHLVDCREPEESWSAPQFAAEALRILREKDSQGIPMVAVGGSGFYLRALLDGAPEGEAPDPTVREMVTEKVASLGLEDAHRWLGELDPEAAKRLHPNDTMRVKRAIEKALSPTPPPTSKVDCWGPQNAKVFGIECSRDRLDVQLKKRTIAMWKGGLLEETRFLLNGKVPKEAPVWGAIGYQEGAEFLAGKMSEAEALERIFRRTRQYAKRQWTWFRHHHQTEWVHLDSFPDTESVVLYLAQQLGV
jgi:tRNA dimethylallyltransferase